MTKPINLGKRLPVGDTFLTTTKRMGKGRSGQSKLNAEGTGLLITYVVYPPGTKRLFTKGKRAYYCEVIRITEQTTGVHIGSLLPPLYEGGIRFWQFTYLVKILES